MAKVMIIEDNDVHNMLLCHNMEDLGHEPLSFEYVESAREELERQPPDLFIIDMHIRDSKKSTLDFIKYLSKNRLYKHIPIIIISAYVTREDIERDLPKFDTDNVIEKPFNVDTISAKVKELLKGKK
jgi:two-component system sensor histidine kinase/response regulator